MVLCSRNKKESKKHKNNPDLYILLTKDIYANNFDNVSFI